MKPLLQELKEAGHDEQTIKIIMDIVKTSPISREITETIVRLRTREWVEHKQAK